MSHCIHCNQESNNMFFEEIDNQSIGPFCCDGCLTVYSIIKDKGLGEYYNIKKNVSHFKKRAPVEIRDSLYSYLDDPDFISQYGYQNSQSQWVMDFYLEGIHCLACLWIIEKMPSFVPGVVSSKLNMSKSVATIIIKDSDGFSKVASELESIGYTPHPLKNNLEQQIFKQKEDRAYLLKIGIAAAASGNIMLYAVSLYAGAGIEYESIFNLLTVLFAIPVLTYCAWPFYKTSYYALKSKTLSIDVPISMALIMGAMMGVYNLLTGVHENYFDSLTTLVFLLLLSRYFLKTIQEKGLSTNDLHFFYQGSSVLKQIANGEYKEIHPKFIELNDILKITPNEIIPADGIVTNGITYINNALITGESELQKTQIDDLVFSGTMNVSEEIEFRVLAIKEQTRLGRILADLESSRGSNANIVAITNIISKYFVLSVLVLSLILFFYLMSTHSSKEAIEKALTLLIVTCPCALAIATPLTFTKTLSKSASKGLIIKDDLTIEKIKKAKHIFLDKTGTLTYSKLQVSSFDLIKEPKINIFEIIVSLERKSKHPIGACLHKFALESGAAKNNDLLIIQDFKEISGVGVSALINDSLYEIRNYQIFENMEVVANFSIRDEIRPEASQAIIDLKKLNYKVTILSGDKRDKVKEVATKLGLTDSEWLAEVSPEEKAKLLKSTPDAIMVGDGANDALALKEADIGIAVYGAMDISLRASDVYLTSPGILSIVDLIHISHQTMSVVYRNLTLSLCYNSISVVLAFTGLISPLTAAIIMPVSSLTVLISTLIGTKRLRELWR